MRYLNFLLYSSCLILPALGLGCMPVICEGNSENKLIECDGKYCGTFKGLRFNGEIAEAIDLSCGNNSDVFAPFDGEIHYWRPFGGDADLQCADEGVKINGLGQWQGFRAYIVPLLLDRYGGEIKKGERLGSSRDLQCTHKTSSGLDQPHIRLYLYRENRFVDPTYHLSECMCTGQICETNANNELANQPFKYDERYGNVRGWDIKCEVAKETKDGNEVERAPKVYSPIEAKWIGRKRLYDVQGEYPGCDNNGIVLTGTGSWEDFEVVMYNVHFDPEILGHIRVIQGQEIGTRLTCDNSPDTVFMEIRYHGDVVDISDLISGNLCKKPEFVNQ